MRFIFIFSLFILAHAQNNNNLPNLKIIWIDWDPCYQLGELSQDFEGATFETTCVSPNDWHSVIWDQWGDENGYDIVILDSQWMGEGSEHLVDISNFMNNELDLDDFYPIPLSAYGEYPPQSGVYYGAPLFADVQFLVYRKDVFESLGIRDVFSLSNLIDVAEQIKEARKDVDGMWGFASFYCGNATICYDELATVFNQFAWNQGGEIWDETQYRVKGVLDSAQNEEALRQLRRLYKTGGGAQMLQWSFGPTLNAICSGQAAMINIWAAFGPNLVDPSQCEQVKIF